MGLEPSPTLPEAGESSWLWAWILVGWAVVLTIVLLQSQRSVSFVRWVFGTRAVDFGLRVRSSALFAWMLLVLDVGIFFFFVVLQLVVTGLLFDGFHESWGAPVFLWWLGQTALGQTPVMGIWVTLAARLVFFARGFPAQYQTASPRNAKQTDARTQSKLARLPTWDHLLVLSAGMTLLWAFPWPQHSAFPVPPTDELSHIYLALRVLIGAVAAILQYLSFQSIRAARDKLHGQIDSIGTSRACVCECGWILGWCLRC